MAVWSEAQCVPRSERSELRLEICGANKDILGSSGRATGDCCTVKCGLSKELVVKDVRAVTNRGR